MYRLYVHFGSKRSDTVKMFLADVICGDINWSQINIQVF